MLCNKHYSTATLIVESMDVSERTAVVRIFTVQSFLIEYHILIIRNNLDKMTLAGLDTSLCSFSPLKVSGSEGSSCRYNIYEKVVAIFHL